MFFPYQQDSQQPRRISCPAHDNRETGDHSSPWESTPLRAAMHKSPAPCNIIHSSTWKSVCSQSAMSMPPPARQARSTAGASATVAVAWWTPENSSCSLGTWWFIHTIPLVSSSSSPPHLQECLLQYWVSQRHRSSSWLYSLWEFSFSCCAYSHCIPMQGEQGSTEQTGLHIPASRILHQYPLMISGTLTQSNGTDSKCRWRSDYRGWLAAENKPDA